MDQWERTRPSVDASDQWEQARPGVDASDQWEQARPAADASDQWEQARPAARTRRGAVVATVALLAVVGAVLALSDTGDRTDPADDELTIEPGPWPEEPTGGPESPLAAPALDGAWRALSPSPLTPRSHAVAAWTGQHVLVWGGVTDEQRTLIDQDGAAVSAILTVALLDGGLYDPEADSWQAIAEAPLPRETPGSHGGVWTGQRLIVFNDAGAAVYDPAEDDWRRVADPPSGSWRWEAAVWTGEEVVVLGRAEGADAAAAYVPESDAWRRLPAPPITDARTAGLNGHAIVYGQWDAGPDGSVHAISAFDPERGEWAEPDPVPQQGVVAEALGAITADEIRNRVVLLGAAFEGTSRSGAAGTMSAGRGAWRPFLAAWRPGEGGGWRTHPRPDEGRETAQHLTTLRAGTILWVEDLQPAGLLFSFEGWRRIPAVPMGPRVGSAVVWTGEHLVVWGGRSARGPLGVGMRWRLLDREVGESPAGPVPGPPRDEWPFGAFTE